MKNDDVISVIVPAFNRHRQVGRAIRSVLGQNAVSASSIEVIVVDDASEPPLQISVQDARIKLVRLQNNVGPSGARNAGIAASRGSLIALLDSDDVWLPGKLSSQLSLLKALRKNDSSCFNIAVSCGCLMPKRNSKQLETRIPVPANRLENFVSGCWYNPGSTLIAEKSVFDAVGPYDVRLRRLEDLDWAIRFGQLGGRLIVAEQTGSIVTPSGTASVNDLGAAATLIEQKYAPHGPSPLSPHHFNRMKAYMAIERAAVAWNNGFHYDAIVEMTKSIMRVPRMRIHLENFYSVRATTKQESARILDTEIES